MTSLTWKTNQAHTALNPAALITPIFVGPGDGLKLPLASIPGQFCRSVDMLPNHLESLLELGLREFLLFSVPDRRLSDDEFEPKNSLAASALELIRRAAPRAVLIADLCVCQSLSHGHCRVGPGTPGEDERTEEALVALAISFAQAGADWVMPSAMLDGQVSALREGFTREKIGLCKILSQSVKAASGLYGPFRAAAHSGGPALSKSDYQNPVPNKREALRELLSDVEEGADMVMVKPALTNLDALSEFKTLRTEPIAAFMTSGESALLKSGPEQYILPRAFEAAAAAFRAGADRLVTYFAEDIAREIKRSG